MIKYALPRKWMVYDAWAIALELADAKAAVLSLQTMPYQRAWVEALQRMELKMEVAGTSRIEGAEFTERELEAGPFRAAADASQASCGDPTSRDPQASAGQ